FRDDENPQELAATGEALVVKYMDYLAPTIDPAVVELRVEGEIGGVKVRGWIDLLERLREDVTPRKPFKSIKGLWADLSVTLTAEEIEENRREMWKNFPGDF